MRRLKRPHGLTIEQRNAVDLLVSGGLPDRVVADTVGVSRITVTRWRLYDPTFQAALNHRRNELWRDSVDGARSLLPAALHTVAEQIAIGDQRGRLALDFLRSAGVFGRSSAGALATHLVGPTDPDEILDQEVLRRRARFPSTHLPDLATDRSESSFPTTEHPRSGSGGRQGVGWCLPPGEGPRVRAAASALVDPPITDEERDAVLADLQSLAALASEVS